MQRAERRNLSCEAASAADRVVHDWYRFVLSFPPQVVRSYLDRFSVGAGQCVLDPFCGTGTTLVECKKRGIRSIGIDVNPISCFASRVKTDWTVDPGELWSHARAVAEIAFNVLEKDSVPDEGYAPIMSPPEAKIGALRKLPSQQERLLLANSISPLPLHKA